MSEKEDWMGYGYCMRGMYHAGLIVFEGIVEGK